MIGFNRKKLISSLAASAMVATATLAPLPGLLSTVHAATTIQIGNPAVIDLGSTNSGLNGVNVTITYKCSPVAGPPVNTAGTASVVVTQTTAQSGTGVGDTADTSINPTAVVCDNTTRQVTFTAYGSGNFNVGTASVTATLTDPAGTTSTSGPTTVRVTQ